MSTETLLSQADKKWITETVHREIREALTEERNKRNYERGAGPGS